jgi:transcription elongation factor Elf1
MITLKYTGNDKCPFGQWKIEKLEEKDGVVYWTCPVCNKSNISEQTFSTHCKYCGNRCCG